MSSPYKAALRQLRRTASSDSLSFVSDLFPVSWAYRPEVESSGPETPSKKLLAQVNSPSVEEVSGVTEKTKVLDSLQDFARKQLDQSDEDSFAFPGGEVRKKDSRASVFESIKCDEMTFEELKNLSSSRGKAFGELKYSMEPKKPLKAMFVAECSEPVDGLREDSLGLEAFFEPAAARLFDRMISAMNFGKGEFLVSSLNVLTSSPSTSRDNDSFEQSLANEIFNFKPKLVFALGGGATAALLGPDFRLQSSHGQFFGKEVFSEGGNSHPFEVMPLFSPAFLVEAPNSKRIAWEDMQKAMKKLGL